MTIESALNLGLPAAPLAQDANLNGELQIVYNALRILQQALNDAGIPSGGVTPAPGTLAVINGGTGVATITGLIKGNGISPFSAASSGTDYAPATSGTSILYGNGSGGFSSVTIGTGISFVAGTLSAAGSGGTVTSVGGTAPVASSGGTTPAISLNAGYGDTLNPYAAKTANYVLAGPTAGASAVPAFRALVAADIPSLTGTYVPYTGATADVDLDTFMLNAKAFHAKGTGGNGHLGLKHQSSTPSSTANESSIFADTNGNLGWVNGNKYLTTFSTSGNTANKTYTFPNTTGTVALTSDLTSYLTSVSGTAGRVSSTGGTTPVIDLVSGIASAGTTGSSTLIPVVTIDTYGRVTSITTAANPQGTVTSVGGTGTVNGLSLSGTVTSSGNLTLGGTLDLSSPPAIGGTSAASGKFTTLGVTGLITSTLTSGEVMKIGSTTSGTGIIYMDMFNTSGGLYLGLEGSAGGVLWTNIPAYATGLGGRNTGGGISFSANAITQHMLLTTTGLAVTGTLSATGITTVAAGSAALPAIVSTTGTADTGLWFPAADTIAFSTAASERMRLDSSGNLLVGTTSGTFNKFVKSNNGDFVLRVENSLSTSPYVLELMVPTASANDTSYAYWIARNADGTNRAFLYGNGGLANYSANNVNLSDRREKTNFAPATSYLDKICAIPIQTFNYIDQNLETDSGLTLGVVAQDVQAVAPELVTESNWGNKEEPKMRLSVYQTDLQYALMKCIQEMKLIIDDQAARIATLEAK